MARLDIEQLLQDISADAPSGPSLEEDEKYAAFFPKLKIEPAREIGREGEKGYMRIGERLPPWSEVREDALALLQRTRDLHLMAELARACLNTDGFQGLADSLELLWRSLEAHWGTLHPSLSAKTGAADDRADCLRRLGDLKTFLRFVNTAPLLESRTFGRYSLANLQAAAAAQEGAPPPGQIKAAFIQAIESAPEDPLPAERLIQACLSHLAQIEQVFAAKAGGNVPNVKPLRDRLKECLQAINEPKRLAAQTIAEEKAKKLAEAEAKTRAAEQAEEEKRLAAEAEAARLAEKEEAEKLAAETASIKLAAIEKRKAIAAQGASGVAGIHSNEDVVAALDLICDYYASHEPSSPIPLLLRRAKRLVGKNFMDIIEDLAPDGMRQVELIKGNYPEEAAEEKEDRQE